MIYTLHLFYGYVQVHPYLVNDKLAKKKKQPKFVKETNFNSRILDDVAEVGDGDVKENRFENGALNLARVHA